MGVCLVDTQGNFFNEQGRDKKIQILNRAIKLTKKKLIIWMPPGGNLEASYSSLSW